MTALTLFRHDAEWDAPIIRSKKCAFNLYQSIMAIISGQWVNRTFRMIFCYNHFSYMIFGLPDNRSVDYCCCLLVSEMLYQPIDHILFASECTAGSSEMMWQYELWVQQSVKLTKHQMMLSESNKIKNKWLHAMEIKYGWSRGTWETQ